MSEPNETQRNVEQTQQIVRRLRHLVKRATPRHLSLLIASLGRSNTSQSKQGK
jgi:hypothetical protein